MESPSQRREEKLRLVVPHRKFSTTRAMGKPVKLEGRKNFDSWRVEAKAYLATKGHWKCFDGTETDSDKNFLAIQAMNLLLTAPLYTYTEGCTMAKDAWTAIENAFTDTGVGRRSDLLVQLVTLKLGDCSSMEDYVHMKLLMASKMKKAGCELGDDIIAYTMLGGLPEEYRPMKMAIENTQAKLSSDYVQNRLLQEVAIAQSNENGASAMFAKKRHNYKNKKKQQTEPKSKSQTKQSVTCYACDEEGHFANKCPKKKQNKELFLCSYVAQRANSREWFIDSGASAHMTMSDSNFIDIHAAANTEIIVGNNSRLNVKSAGDIEMTIDVDSNTKQNAQQTF